MFASVQVSKIPKSPFRIRFMAVGSFISRNLVSIAFPVLTVTAIYADWNHTRKWKESVKQNQN